MFLLVAAEQVRRLLRRADDTAGAIGMAADSDAAKPSPRASPLASPLDAVAQNVPAGTRYQLLRALRAMAAGEVMVVEHRIPSLTEHFENSYKRSEWFSRLRNTDSWQDQNDIDPVLVPGTAYPCVIGRILIRAGWCAPCSEPHWVPNLRFFFLTEVGRESFRNAQAWWSELSTLERMRVMLLE
jgi:hypothetical protein